MAQFFTEIWAFIVASAPFLLLGFALAGPIKAFLELDRIRGFLGGRGLRASATAAAVGVPLPLCSCSVLPTAATLRKGGASTSSTSSFLISTPETGVDSILMTYSIMDLPMTIFRPFAAFCTAVFAGILNGKFNDVAYEEVEEVKSCCPSTQKKSNSSKNKLGERLLNGIKYSFVDLVDDISGWLSFGIILGALVAVLIPEDFLRSFSGETHRLVVLLVALPTYICASASTPLAASLVAKGMSPGASMILLMLGPATNLANIAVVQKYIGKRGVIINLVVLTTCAFVFSYLIDWFYATVGPINLKITSHHEHASWIDHLWGVVLLALLIQSRARYYLRRFSK